MLGCGRRGSRVVGVGGEGRGLVRVVSTAGFLLGELEDALHLLLFGSSSGSGDLLVLVEINERSVSE
jgi:hypothetical protein